MSGFRAYVCVLVLAAASSGSSQTVRLALPGASGQTAIFDAQNQLSVVTHSVPAGYMDLYPAYRAESGPPVIIVEGFDPTNKTVPDAVYQQVNVLGGIDTVRAAGRDVWIVNFGDGGGAIAANAKLVSSAVAQAANYGGLASGQVDIIGLSMGGVITRWALAADEAGHGPSDGLVRLFVSGDSPQQGANANPNLQELIIFQNSPDTLPLMRSDAAVSMLYQSVLSFATNGCALGALPSATSFVSSPAAHDWFYNALNALNGDGYPHKSRNVAISNGSWSALPYATGDWLAACRTYANFIVRIQVCSQTYSATATDVGPGSLAGDFAAGNIRTPEFEMDQHFVPAFIPAGSALDMRSGQSMFDRTLVQMTAQNHSTITPATNAFMLDEVLGAGAKVNPCFMPDGATANIAGLVVTGVYAGRFYAEQPDRAWGVAVESPAAVAPGDTVTIFGPMATRGGERAVAASSVTITGHASPPAPLTMKTGALGGGLVGQFSAGVTGGVGASNTGLLVRTGGLVTGVADDQSFFTINDGSGDVRVLVTGLSAGQTIAAPPVGEFVTVTGASSTSDTGSAVLAAIRPRDQGDIEILTQP
ncbi:MAG: hypothetical protein IT209_00400 [Armatimonadetes bacterium]|nr:hypothetical protein [Armatimonadota bacterium]